MDAVKIYRMRFLYMQAMAQDLFLFADNNKGEYVELFIEEVEKCLEVKDRQMGMRLALSLLDPETSDAFARRHPHFTGHIVHCYFRNFFNDMLDLHEFELRDLADPSIASHKHELFNAPPTEIVAYFEPLIRETVAKFATFSELPLHERHPHNIWVWLLWEWRCHVRDEQAEQPYDVIAARKLARLELAHNPD